MKNTFPVYCRRFACIADKCTDTCCAGWAVAVDDASAERYSKAGGKIGEKLRASLVTDEDGDRIFRSTDGRCPFLLESGLCEIYSELGESELCITCTRYPRFVTDMGSRIETGISLSCPEAARLIIGDPERTEYITEETDGTIHPSDFDPELYFFILKLRKKCFEIIHDRGESTDIRMARVLLLCEKADRFVRHGGDEESVFEKTELPQVHRAPAAKKAFGRYISDHLKTEMLTSDWSGILACASLTDEKYPAEYELEHLAEYYIFRYLMTAVFDGDILTKAKFCALAYTVTKSLCVREKDKAGRLRLMQRYSKETEHSAYNTSFLTGCIRKSRFYSTDNLINILIKGENI